MVARSLGETSEGGEELWARGVGVRVGQAEIPASSRWLMVKNWATRLVRCGWRVGQGRLRVVLCGWMCDLVRTSTV